MKYLILITVLMIFSGCNVAVVRLNFRDKAGDTYSVAVARNSLELGVDKAR